jgi:hypothetical protein
VTHIGGGFRQPPFAADSVFIRRIGAPAMAMAIRP